MQKRMLCLLLAGIMVFTAGFSHGMVPVAEAASESLSIRLPEEPPEARYGIDMPYTSIPTVSGVHISPYRMALPASSNGVNPYDDVWLNAGVLPDLSDNLELAYRLSVSDTTLFQASPDGYDQNALIQWGKAPGLNVEILHDHGFTGEGAVIAYIDQPFTMHPEYESDKIHYSNLTDSDSSMHGPAVISLLTGKTIGTAPDAKVYFYAHASWEADQTTHAEALYALMEQNKTLPEEKRITMVGFSDNIDPSEKNMQTFQDAVKACEDSGVMVFFCGDYCGGAFFPMSDKNNPQNLVCEVYGSPSNLIVPTSGRTTVYNNFLSEYIYWSRGGISWAMPYMLGLYAIATQIDPTLTKAQLLSTAKDTAYMVDGKAVVNPVGFITQVLTSAGRTEEAEAMLAEASYNHRYTYALMNRSAMSSQDLKAVESYLARLTDTTVLIADIQTGVSARNVYLALQADAWKRNGIVEGVQIFGTPDMVPTFTPGYKVQMVNGVDNAGTMCSDLFYGNFLNEVSMLERYNVMDHFVQGLDVALIPCWPVARLPLRQGEYPAFFQKYHAFLRDTKLKQPDLVNFSNPIFASSRHIDDMGKFLTRADTEFQILDVSYRLYGNQDGDVPVSTPVLGNFLPENLAKENESGICEFLINSHGQQNNIDQAIFQNGKEKRISFLNTDTIDSVLDDHPYYLDCWTCNNGQGMKDNLTTAALNGKCVGMFSATHIISNNGVNNMASPEEMANSNFYYFYLNYLAALRQGSSRSQAFFLAQRAYGCAVLDASMAGLTGEGNYQFNLCNLLTYHNFGLLEPKDLFQPQQGRKNLLPTPVPPEKVRYSDPSSPAPYSGPLSSEAPQPTVPQSAEPPGVHSPQLQNVTLGKYSLVIHNTNSVPLEDGSRQYTVEFTGDPGMHVFAFSPPDGDVFGIQGPETDGTHQSFTFTLTQEQLQAATGITVNFFFSDDCRAFLNLSKYG